MKLLMRMILISCCCQAAVVLAESTLDAARNGLGGYEWQMPATAPENLLAAYKTLAASADEPSFIRARALQMLTLYPATSVGEFFVTQLQTMEQSVLRRRLVDNYCLVGAADQPRQVEQAVTPLLQAEDAHLRVAAARCLKQLDTESAREQLAKWVSSREQSWEVTRAGLEANP